MFRFLGILVVLAILVVGFGYYRGWFHAESSDIHGQHAVTVSVDKAKINQDKADVRQQVQDLEHK